MFRTWARQSSQITDWSFKRLQIFYVLVEEYKTSIAFHGGKLKGLDVAFSRCITITWHTTPSVDKQINRKHHHPTVTCSYKIYKLVKYVICNKFRLLNTQMSLHAWTICSPEQGIKFGLHPPVLRKQAGLQSRVRLSPLKCLQTLWSNSCGHG